MAARVGRTLSKDAGKAVEEMYRQAGRGVQDVVKRVGEADEQSAKKLVELAEKMGQNAGRSAVGDAQRTAQVAERAGLRSKFASILDPKGESAAVRDYQDTEIQVDSAISGDRAAHPGGSVGHHLARRCLDAGHAGALDTDHRPRRREGESRRVAARHRVARRG
jgi:hypothetical protein